MNDNHEKSSDDTRKNHRDLTEDRHVKDARSKPGEPPNRDEDEFSNEGLKEPDVQTQVENENDPDKN